MIKMLDLQKNEKLSCWQKKEKKLIIPRLDQIVWLAHGH